MSMIQSHEPSLRPGDWARLVLASDDLLPRQRARDQQADLAGAELKRRVLGRVIDLDPEHSELAATLERIVVEVGEPAGPTRAIALGVREEFDDAARSPEFIAWLVERAADRTRCEDRRTER